MPNVENAPESLEGTLIVPEGTRFAIVAARFNSFIVERLVEGAIDALRRHACRVPGKSRSPAPASPTVTRWTR